MTTPLRCAGCGEETVEPTYGPVLTAAGRPRRRNGLPVYGPYCPTCAEARDLKQGGTTTTGNPTHPNHEQNRGKKASGIARFIEELGGNALAAEHLSTEERRRVEAEVAKALGRTPEDFVSSDAVWVLVVLILRERADAVAVFKASLTSTP